MWQLGAPWFLLLLPLPLLVARMLPPSKSESGALRVPQTIAIKLKAGPGLAAGSSLLNVPKWLVWIGIVFALAAPRMAQTASALPASGRDIFLALDFSGSMLDQDLRLDGKPAARQDVMKHVAKEFISRRSGDRIGLVVFASDAYVAAPLSFDLAAVQHSLDEVNVDMMGMSKTAMGDGLGLALKRLRDAPAHARVIILMSDGGNNAGSAEPIPVAHLAKSLGIRIDTIALVPTPVAGVVEDDDDAADTATLKAIADVSGGRAFLAHSKEELEDISHSIDRLESGTAKAPPSIIYQDLWTYPGALAFFAAIACLILDRRRA